MRFGAQELLLFLLIIVLLFGAARLPRLARSLREARDEFQKGSSESATAAETSREKPSDEAAAETSREKPSDAT